MKTKTVLLNKRCRSFGDFVCCC